MNASTSPLITLHPLADGNHRWVGLLFCADDALGAAMAVAELLREDTLSAALGGLPCVLPYRLAVATDALPALPAANLMLQLPLAECLDPTTAEALQALRRQGFGLIAEGLPAAGQSLPDTLTAIAAPYRQMRDTPPPAHLPGPHLALGVDDMIAFEGGRAGGRWMAGNYPLHPGPQKSGTSSPARAVMLKLLGQITGDADDRAIEATLKHDPQLSVQLLKLVNSVSFSLNKQITSFSQAIALLGRRQLQRWLQLLLYARPAGKPNECSPLMPRAALRAGLMEGLCRTCGGGKEDQDRAFMVGMFSLLEALLGQSMSAVVPPLNLAEDVASALLGRRGSLGAWLALVEAAENGPGAQTAAALKEVAVTPAAWARLQAQAFAWALQISREA